MVAQFSRKTFKIFDMKLEKKKLLFQENCNRFSAAMNLLLNHLTIYWKRIACVKACSKYDTMYDLFFHELSFCYFFTKYHLKYSKISHDIFHHQRHWFQVATTSVAPSSFLWIPSNKLLVIFPPFVLNLFLKCFLGFVSTDIFSPLFVGTSIWRMKESNIIY